IHGEDLWDNDLALLDENDKTEHLKDIDGEDLWDDELAFLDETDHHPTQKTDFFNPAQKPVFEEKLIKSVPVFEERTRDLSEHALEAVAAAYNIPQELVEEYRCEKMKPNWMVDDVESFYGVPKDEDYDVYNEPEVIEMTEEEMNAMEDILDEFEDLCTTTSLFCA
ncbi:MAG: hypothetical protein LUF92_13990, partial [Clostridiales bacterium]|nr:hypothetical protein [Clostridiales bacterium]